MNGKGRSRLLGDARGRLVDRLAGPKKIFTLPDRNQRWVAARMMCIIDCALCSPCDDA